MLSSSEKSSLFRPTTEYKQITLLEKKKVKEKKKEGYENSDLGRRWHGGAQVVTKSEKVKPLEYIEETNEMIQDPEVHRPIEKSIWWEN